MQIVSRLGNAVRHAATLRATWVAALMVLGACVFGSRVHTGPVPVGPGPQWMPAGSRGQTILSAFGWQQSLSPLYTDDQRLHKSQTEFGQYAWIAPNPTLDTLSTFSSGSDGVLVALLYVEPDPGTQLPQTYVNLKLSEGLNCIYLYRAGSADTGFVRKADPGPTPTCPNTFRGPEPIPVFAEKYPAYPNVSDIPAVARFHEGENATLGMTNAPYFGAKCSNAWCRFVPTSVTPGATPQSTDGNDRVHKVSGWGDAQHVAMVNGPATTALLANLTAAGTMPAAPPVVMKSDDMVGWIVPDSMTKHWKLVDYANTWRHVATVKFADGPRDKYMRRWHFEPHTTNDIYIRMVDSVTNRWEGYMVRRTYIWIFPMPWKREFSIRVERDPHPGMTVAATARFRWDPVDEDIWVGCDAGCCKVSEW